MTGLYIVKTGRFFFTGCHFKYDRFVHTSGATSPQEPRLRSVFLKDCTFETGTHNNYFFAYGAGQSGTRGREDGYYADMINCTFIRSASGNCFSKVGSANFHVGVFRVISPTGSISNTIANSDLRNKVQRNNEVVDGYRIFQGTNAPVDGIGWKVGDRILPDISNHNSGWVCTTAGTGGVDAVFVQIQ